MSQKTNFAILSLLLTSMATTGCLPTKGTAGPEDYFGLIQVAFQGGEIAAMIGRNEAIQAKNFPGCVSAEVLESAFNSAGRALRSKTPESVEIPGFEVDMSTCMAFRGPVEVDPVETPDSVQGNEDVAVLVEAIAGIAILGGTHYANKLKATDCKRGELALAALGYLRGMVKPIADEIALPDGVVVIPSVVLPLHSCEN